MEYTTNGTDLKQKTHAVLSDEKKWLTVSFFRGFNWTWDIPSGNLTQLLNMVIYTVVDLPIEHGGSFHSYVS